VNIGEPKRTIEIEPVTVPVPQEVPIEEPEPTEEPVPVEEPGRGVAR
jgi:hypothetical protein